MRLVQTDMDTSTPAVQRCDQRTCAENPIRGPVALPGLDTAAFLFPFHSSTIGAVASISVMEYALW